jgi:hypothetical protein
VTGPLFKRQQDNVRGIISIKWGQAAFLITSVKSSLSPFLVQGGEKAFFLGLERER